MNILVNCSTVAFIARAQEPFVCKNKHDEEDFLPEMDCLELLAINGIPHFALGGFQPQAKSASASARNSLEPHTALSAGVVRIFPKQ